MTETSNGQDSPPADDETALEGESAECRVLPPGPHRQPSTGHPTIEALAKWKQTDVISGVPLTWIVPSRHSTPVTGIEAGFTEPRHRPGLA
ncbi:MAG: hypothetical protein WKF76_09480 [Nocardioidaceae bacterium]